MSAGDLHNDAMITKSSLLCRRALVCRKSLSLGYTSVISFSPDYDNRLPIVLFVGQHLDVYKRQAEDNSQHGNAVFTDGGGVGYCKLFAFKRRKRALPKGRCV